MVADLEIVSQGSLFLIGIVVFSGFAGRAMQKKVSAK